MCPLNWQKRALPFSLLFLDKSQSSRAVAERTAFDRRFIVRNCCDGWACETFWGPLIVDIGADEVHAIEFNVQALLCPREKFWLERFSVMTFRMIGGNRGAVRRVLSNGDAFTISVPFV